jgi:predicted ATPase/class 3 adenylate cyclase
MMSEFPRGTVTFLFTDIEGSTRLWERDRPAMAMAVDRHLTLLRTAIETHDGVLFKVIGDAVQAAFPAALSAVMAAVAAQEALGAERWPEPIGVLRVRMALHAGEAQPQHWDYLAPTLNRLARLLAAGHGGQILVTQVVHALLGETGRSVSVTLRDLGEHRLRDLVKPERVWQVVAPGLPADFPPLVTLSSPHTNLVPQPTALIGRAREVAEVRALLGGDQTRLVTLTGPGGTGKTRLALQIAGDLLETTPDGVYVVDLSSVTDAALMPPVIAAVLGLREEGSRDLRETLLAYLTPKALLLVLDNLEQIRPAEGVARLIADLLAACPTLRVLATSRAPLKVRAEREYPVLPLPSPDTACLPPLGQVAENPAVQLFVERAQAVRPAFALTADNAPVIAEICERLDGLPLAIELAAARIRVLAPNELARRLGNQLDLLAGRVADRPDRQQTLRAAIAWSYDLLASEEQALFRRVSVFAGGCTLETAEAIAATRDPLALDVLDGMTMLVEQSLVRVDDTPDGARYGMLETLRAYGQEQLQKTGEDERVRSSHATIVLACVKTGTDGLRGPDPAHWSTVLVAEHDNLRAALRWTRDAGHPETALALASTAWSFWETRGYLTEGRMWLDQVLAASSADATPERAEALMGAGVLARLQGDLTAAAALTEESLGFWRQLGDRAGEGRALRWFGVVADARGDEARAMELFQQSLAIAREADDAVGIAAALNSLGVVLWNTGQVAAAQARLEESLALERRTGQRARLPIPLNNLALLAIEAGELAQARVYLEESLAIDQELGRQSGVADTLLNLGAIAFEEGNVAQAAQLNGEGLQIHREIGDPVSVAYGVESLAAVAASTGDFEAAARLYGAAAALRAEIGAPLPESEAVRHERGLGKARAGLRAAAFTAAWDAGHGWSWMQAAEEALGIARRIALPASRTA